MQSAFTHQRSHHIASSQCRTTDSRRAVHPVCRRTFATHRCQRVPECGRLEPGYRVGVDFRHASLPPNGVIASNSEHPTPGHRPPSAYHPFALFSPLSNWPSMGKKICLELHPMPSSAVPLHHPGGCPCRSTRRFEATHLCD